MSVADAVQRVQALIDTHERTWNRAPGSTALLAVGKRKPAGDLRAAIDAGLRRFGENYLDEAVGKIDEIGRCAPDGSALEWHYIGAIQSRKSAGIAERFDWVHGVDRLKVASKLSGRRVQTHDEPLSVCLQVNPDGEAGKAGVAPEALEELAGEVAALPGLVLRGVMSIPAPRERFDDQREVFARLHELQRALARHHPSVDTLSCGMSGDLEAAIAEGSTLVRVGTALFGARE